MPVRTTFEMRAHPWSFVLLVAVLACGEEKSTGYRAKERLSATGLYGEGLTVGTDALAYAPAYALWSDGAEKTRWLVLPDSGAIDASEPDAWVFPKGTRLFKEFVRDGKRLETRLIERYGDSAEDTAFLTYAWLDDESDALLLDEGRTNARATNHDIPAQAMCLDCHGGEAGRVLGFSAMQLSHAAGRAIVDELVMNGRIVGFAGHASVPGTEVEASALGYLHANCGNCHNPTGFAAEATALTLRLSTSDATPADTAAYHTAIDVDLSSWRTFDYSKVVVPGDADASGLMARMLARDKDAMPPIATEEVDETGVALIRAWIEQLPAAVE